MNDSFLIKSLNFYLRLNNKLYLRDTQINNVYIFERLDGLETWVGCRFCANINSGLNPPLRPVRKWRDIFPISAVLENSSISYAVSALLSMSRPTRRDASFAGEIVSLAYFPCSLQYFSAFAYRQQPMRYPRFTSLVGATRGFHAISTAYCAPNFISF